MMIEILTIKLKNIMFFIFVKYIYSVIHIDDTGVNYADEILDQKCIG